MAHRSVPTANTSLADVENWLALGAGAALLLVGASRRTRTGTLIAASSAPLLYRGITGQWPVPLPAGSPAADTRRTLGGSRGVQVRESIRLERPLPEVFQYWRQLEHLPEFMTHLDRVTGGPDGTSHWVAAGPGGIAVEWDARIINEVPDKLIAWQSVPGSDIATAGSVNFDTVRGGRSTQVTVHLQYAPPAGRAGALLASLFGREPSQTIREDLRRFKQLLEAGEAPRATATA